jgi:hypothetical protein
VDTPASSTTKTDSHDIAEILMKVALKQQKNQKNQTSLLFHMWLAERFNLDNA